MAATTPSIQWALRLNAQRGRFENVFNVGNGVVASAYNDSCADVLLGCGEGYEDSEPVEFGQTFTVSDYALDLEVDDCSCFGWHGRSVSVGAELPCADHLTHYLAGQLGDGFLHSCVFVPGVRIVGTAREN